MKRLSLADFQAKKIQKASTNTADQFLGQVLGNCHDTPTSGGENTQGQIIKSNYN